MSDPMNLDEFDELLSCLIDGRLNANEHQRLESAMRQSADCRKRYRDMMRLHASLAWSRSWWLKQSGTMRDPIEGGSDVPSPAANLDVVPSVQTHSPANRKHVRVLSALLVLATVFLMLLGFSRFAGDRGVSKSPVVSTRVLNSEHRIDSADLEESMDHSSEESELAVISDAVGMKWSEGDIRRAGESLTAGPLKFDSGLLQLDFSSGARLVCRGPASLELISAKCVRIYSGEATCYVGELGKGFQVLTGESEVIDLGTSFGIRVDNRGDSEIHVFDGAVSVRQQPESDAVEYTEKTAVRLSPKEMTKTDFSSEGFPKFEELRSLREEQWSNRYLAWKDYAKSISEDPSVLVHYTFEDQKQSDIEVFNQSRGESRGTSGTILRAKWCEGRWPNKKGLRFQQESDRVLLKVPGKYSELSFVTWARPDAFLQSSSVLLLTEHPRRWFMHGTLNDELRDTSAPTDTFRWVLTDRNVARLSLAIMDKAPLTYNTSEYVSGARPGAENQNGVWGCYGVTIDPQAMQVSHFYNGKRTSVTQLDRMVPLPLETMEMGNHSTTPAERKAGMGYRFFGVIDELIIANRVFDSEEMATIYEIGRQDQN